MTKAHKLFVALVSVGLTGLTGCDVPPTAAPVTPAMRPPPPQPKVTPQSENSAEMARYFARQQASFLVNDLLRVDGGGVDAPFTQRNLVDNFIRIALFDEYTNNNGRLATKETETRLRRWDKPIRMKIEFGPSVPLAQRTKDRSNIGAYIKRLSHLTGIPMRLTSGTANFHVLILNEDERRAAGPRLKALAPDIPTATLNLATHMDRATFCLVTAYSEEGDNSNYFKSIAIIRGEHPDLLRLACVHEELAQGLGLANDSRAARPSIFNDDQEFALLTRHDELLLKMLYDKRLRPGMTAREVRPIATKIAAELMGGPS